MLGRVIDEILTDEERGRLLTTGFAPKAYVYADDTKCFYGAAGNASLLNVDRSADLVDKVRLIYGLYAMRPNVYGPGSHVASYQPLWFDGLCERFGVPRIANAIRNRVLSPRSRAERIASRASLVWELP